MATMIEPQMNNTADTDTRDTYQNLIEIFAKLWKSPKSPIGEELFLTQRLLQTLVVLLLFISSMSFVRFLFGKWGRASRKVGVEVYALVKSSLLFTALLFNWWEHLPLWFVWYCLSDLFVNLSAFVVLRGYWKEPASTTRSLILLAFNFLEYTSAFGVLYLKSKVLSFADGKPVLDGLSAFYFSVITAATVGYGDISPNVALGRQLVCLEVILSLAFVAILVASFVSELRKTVTND